MSSALRHWASAAGALLRNLAEPNFAADWLSAGLRHDQRRRLPVRHLLAAFPQTEQICVDLVNLNYRMSNLTPYDLYCLIAIAKTFDAKMILEIGTFDGGTTIQLARNLLGAEITTIDLAPADLTDGGLGRLDDESANVAAYGVGSKFLGTPEAIRITQLRGDSTRIDWKPFERTFDLVFIDGSHQYKYVRTDSENALRVVRPGGTVIWDDYLDGWPGVVRAVDEVAAFGNAFTLAGTALAVLQLP